VKKAELWSRNFKFREGGEKVESAKVKKPQQRQKGTLSGGGRIKGIENLWYILTNLKRGGQESVSKGSRGGKQNKKVCG